MNSNQLVNNLNIFYTFAKSLEKEMKKDTTSEEWEIIVKSNYLFITIEISKLFEDDKKVLFNIQFKLNGINAELNSLYCHENFKEEEVRAFISLKKMNPYSWVNNPDSIMEIETINYLSISDTIAQIAYNNSSGDQYAPSYYSEVILSDKEITLIQSNYHNSRSINHKEDYFLRDLKIRIPLYGKILKPKYDEESLGKMLVLFNDRSSKNNKTYGNLISEEIERQKGLLIA